MFARQVPVTYEMDFNQAMARGLQYNLDLRINQANTALKAGQMKLAEYAMMPELDATGSAYTRDNDNTSYGSDQSGNRTDQITTGSDRTIRAFRLAVKWNLLDLGRGYVKAREQGEKLLIAEEESRKQLQKLVQDLRVGYWRAYSAQQLAGELQQFYPILKKAKAQISQALIDKIVPKEDLLNYQTALLEGNRRLVQLEDKLNKAELQFKFLINLPPEQQIKLKKPPSFITKIQDLNNLNFEKLDAITLVNRPELRSQDYQRRIAKLGTKAAIIEALPSITLNGGRNFNSNSFLVNNFWNDRSIEASWNVFNLASLPVSLKNVDTQTNYESLKLMALTLGALNETRLAYAHYQTIAKEGLVARKQTKNAQQIYNLMQDREQASLTSKQQVYLAKLHLIFAKMDEILLMSDVYTALGELYLASGFDVLPPEATQACPQEVLAVIERNLSLQETSDFKHYVNLTYEKVFENSECN
jgi:outer membrane protein TolC